ncbi:hypothetical protein CLCR_08035 [Cladophialophora carrionii]|uniref:Uncharacterized protein n=1 Tax=Cladophialophora carrionii TaxID=86049 RepID=A0A1C1CTV3_9EURO|nr:hypothetical protein CLCR_08035 [Cladophialophora carrionii]
MASPLGNEVALRQPFSNTGSQSSSFSQQGSLDWVAFGRIQYSASVAVLGRLAGAGVDTLTVAFGQAMCSAIPLGIHGERVLQDAMKRLSACSTFGDLVWFGVGVRHILRDLVQTTQGSALVALCGALSEGYSSELSALVLHEMSDSVGAPGELRPSFPQWHALSKVTASVFVESTFGLRIRQFMRLSGLPQDCYDDPGHPTDLAQVILAVGRLSSGAVETLYIQGGPACSWVATFADLVLGLRLQLLSCQGDLIFMNYDPALLSPQAIITFILPGIGRSTLRCTGSTAVVRSGGTFISDFFGDHSDNPLRRSGDHAYMFSGGRVEWANMLQDTFGEDFSELLRDSVDLGPDENQRPSSLSVEPKFQKHRSRLFARVLASGTLALLEDTMVCHLHKGHTAFIMWLVERISELRPLTSILLNESVRVRKKAAESRDASFHCYKTDRRRLEGVCGCDNHHCQRIVRTDARRSCLRAIAETVLQLSRILSVSILHGEYRPSRRGLMLIYERAAERSTIYPTNPNLYRPPSDWRKADENVLYLTFSLYSGPRSIPFSNGACAYSDGNVFAYMGTLEKATDSVEEAVLIYVGAGAIQHGPAVYRTVSGLVPYESYQEYPVRHTRPTNGLADLNQDTTSRDLRLYAMVQERFDGLAFWYRASSEYGMITFSPTALVDRLISARRYLQLPSAHYPSAASSPDDSIFGKWEKCTVEGEGIMLEALEGVTGGLVLRPLRENTLGRCVAIARSWAEVFLIKNGEELDVFSQYCAERFASKSAVVRRRNAQRKVRDDESDLEDREWMVGKKMKAMMKATIQVTIQATTTMTIWGSI